MDPSLQEKIDQLVKTDFCKDESYSDKELSKSIPIIIGYIHDYRQRYLKFAYLLSLFREKIISDYINIEKNDIAKIFDIQSEIRRIQSNFISERLYILHCISHYIESDIKDSNHPEKHASIMDKISNINPSVKTDACIIEYIIEGRRKYLVEPYDKFKENAEMLDEQRNLLYYDTITNIKYRFDTDIDNIRFAMKFSYHRLIARLLQAQKDSSDNAGNIGD